MSEDMQGQGKAWNLPRLVALCLMAYVVLMSYAFSRPTVEAMLTDAHGKESLPRAWLMMSVVAAVTVVLYNRFSQGRTPIKVFGVITAITLGILVLLQGLYAVSVPGITYALFVWKDLYIVFLIEIFWTYANSVYDPKKARWAYGLFLIMGSLGGITGNLAVKPVAALYGTEGVLWLVVPALLVAWGVCLLVNRWLEEPVAFKAGKEAPRFGEGMRSIANSRYMVLLLLLIVVTQVAITLIDYEYNAALFDAYPDDKDVRAGIGGQVYAAIDTSALVLQLLTGPILSALGVSRTLLTIPVLLGGAVAFFVAVPQFLSMAFAKVASKCFDYSLFRAAKEILYIPLTPMEKTQGKAVVDILVYRVTKGAVSLFLIGFLALIKVPGAVMFLTLFVIVVWIVVTHLLLRSHAARVAENDAASASSKGATSL